jgi:hypothetical protein
MLKLDNRFIEDENVDTPPLETVHLKNDDEI